jgi:GDSL-like Lipase/Acylhydrolase
MKTNTTNAPALLKQIVSIAVSVQALACLSFAGDHRADFSRVVVVGDSLLAGFRNGSLIASEQINGISAYLSRQAQFSLVQPLIAEPGIPNKLELLSVSPLNIARAPGVSTGRLDPSTQVNNLAVPGHTVADALRRRPDFAFDDLGDLILGLPGVFGGVFLSQVEWAELMQPSFAIVWLGANDTLGAALEGDASLVTPLEDFARDYAELMDRMAATGAKLIVGNIPDVTVIPYLTPAEDVAEQAGVPLALIGPALGLSEGDYITPDAAPLIPAILGGVQAGPLPANVVLDAGEVATIRAATAKFNRIIARQAKRHDAAHVDLNAFLNSVNRRGFIAGSKRLTTDFLGGFFSLDGFHPTITGSAGAANEFIKILNRSYRAGIPLVNVREIVATDPLVFAAPDRPGKGWGHVDCDTARRMRWILHRR